MKKKATKKRAKDYVRRRTVPKRRFTAECRKRMYEMRRDGSSIAQIADHYDCGMEEVEHVLSEPIR